MKRSAYANYKDSGVQWLGHTPEHWEVRRLKHVASLKSGEGITTEEIDESGEYPVYGGNGLRGYTTNYTHDGQFVLIGRQGALCGNINYAQGKFWASEHAVVVTPIKLTATMWLGELLRSMNLNQYSQSAAQPGLAIDRIKELCMPLPPLSEQRTIAAYLDRETGRINSLIAKKKRLVELLREKRAAMISRAVTKGLDPSVKMKPSGVEWLAHIPEHWEIKRLKFILLKPLQYGANEAAELDDPELPRFVRITDVDEAGNLREETFRSLPEEIAKPFLLDEGDILFARSGATVGKSFFYRNSWGRAAYAGYLIRARIKQSIAQPDFINFITKSFFYQQWINSILIQATIQNVSAEKYASFLLPLPPLSEQGAIVAYLDRETGKIDRLIQKVETAVEKLKEYRTALISAAVTGKIDVRKV